MDAIGVNHLSEFLFLYGDLGTSLEWPKCDLRIGVKTQIS